MAFYIHLKRRLNDYMRILKCIKVNGSDRLQSNTAQIEEKLRILCGGFHKNIREYSLIGNVTFMASGPFLSKIYLCLKFKWPSCQNCNTLIALKYFFKSVNLSQRSVLQDMLRILKIMADFNRDREEHEISRNDPSEFVCNFCLNFSN